MSKSMSPEMTAKLKKLESLEFRYYLLCLALFFSTMLAHYRLVEYAKLSLVFFLVVMNLPAIIRLLAMAHEAIVSFKDSPVTLKRVKKFKSMRRGYYSFCIIFTLFILSFFNEFLINDQALVIKYKSQIYSPSHSRIPIEHSFAWKRIQTVL